jgi:hypothetical protein
LLTLGTYTFLGADDERQALELLPDLRLDAKPTGTDDGDA